MFLPSDSDLRAKVPTPSVMWEAVEDLMKGWGFGGWPARGDPDPKSSVIRLTVTAEGPGRRKWYRRTACLPRQGSAVGGS